MNPMYPTIRRFLVPLLAAFCLTPALAADMTVHVSPTGNDAANGESEASAVATLERALKIAEAASDPKFTQVRIAFEPGTYKAQTATARGNRAGLPVVLTDARSGARVVFDGGGQGGTWFTLKPRGGNPSNIKIIGLDIVNYETAIDVDGSRNSAEGWAGGLEIRDNHFASIGDIARSGARPSTAAIRFVNSDRNVVVNNTFKNIRNEVQCPLLHALYVAHGSTDNLIEGNRFEDSCGDAVRFRDRSDNNLVRNNTFIDAWSRSPVSDWFCNAKQRDNCTKESGECPSSNLRLEGNKMTVRRSPPAQLFVGYGGNPSPACGIDRRASRALIR